MAKKLQCASRSFCLNPTSSTTHLLALPQPIRENHHDAKSTSVLSLPKDKGLKVEGGLRTQGCFKQSLPDKPLITVITVVFNGAEHLEDTIKSVIGQTYPNVEYIIIDGGSTDGTLDIIRKYKQAIDYWVSEKDKGIYEAMNKAVKLARGDWFLFLGSDDLLIDFINEIKDGLLHKQCIYYGNVILSSTGKVSGGPFNPFKLMWKNIPHQAILYPRSVFMKYLYDVSYPLLADYHLNLMLFRDREFRFKYINCVFAVYNNVSGKSSTISDAKFKEDKSRIIYEHYSLLYKLPYYMVKNIKSYLRKVLP